MIVTSVQIKTAKNAKNISIVLSSQKITLQCTLQGDFFVYSISALNQLQQHIICCVCVLAF